MGEEKQIPEELPELSEAKYVNVRKARAGILFASGHGSLQRCLIAAGYSRVTARNQTLNGLGAKQCLDEAAKLDRNVAPAKLLAGGRRILAEQIAFRDPLKLSVRDAIKLVDLTEKYYGGHSIPASNPTLALAERLAGISALLAVARERGLPVDGRTIDAQLVASGRELSKGADSVNMLSVATEGVTRTASDNIDYDNLPPAEKVAD